MTDPFGLQRSNLDASFQDWFMLCERWWAEVGFEQAYDYSHHPWQQWYASGLTVELAVSLAHRETFASDLP